MSSNSESIHILITQCLQNAFFLADDNRLCLPNDVAMRMLLGTQEGVEIKPVADPETMDREQNRRVVGEDQLKTGPLYSFFNAVTTDTGKQHDLHIINVRDWHAPSSYYDEERRLYGVHCEAHTWEARPIKGFDRFLRLWETLKSEDEKQEAKEAARSLKGYQHDNATYYDVRSDSVFDFKPPESEELQTALQQQFGEDKKDVSQLELILDELINNKGKRVYITVIGVYTDIKIKTLLMGLRSRYDIDNLIVSDVLTASTTLERHLEGLDFAAKVLQVEVIHNLNALVHTLNPGEPPKIPQERFKNGINFRDYQSYFLDKQKLLSYQDEKILEYLEATRERTQTVYEKTLRTNDWLFFFGAVLMGITILATLLRLINLVEIPDNFILAIGGISLVQLVTIFFRNPTKDLRNDLNSLVRLRNYLETYSMVSALLRYHLTKPERLHALLESDEEEAQMRSLKSQIQLVEEIAEGLSSAFYDIPGPKRDVPGRSFVKSIFNRDGQDEGKSTT